MKSFQLRSVCVSISIAILPGWMSPLEMFAQNVGEQVVATQKVDLRISGKVIESVGAGEMLKVEKVQGEWLWVLSPSKKKGWLQKKDVGPLSRVTGTMLNEATGQPFKQQSMLLFLAGYLEISSDGKTSVVPLAGAAKMPPNASMGQLMALRWDSLPIAKTDNAGRFRFDRIPPAVYMLAFGRNYDEALRDQSQVLSRNRMVVFKVLPGKDFTFGSILGKVSPPPKKDE